MKFRLKNRLSVHEMVNCCCNRFGEIKNGFYDNRRTSTSHKVTIFYYAKNYGNRYFNTAILIDTYHGNEIYS